MNMKKNIILNIIVWLITLAVIVLLWHKVDRETLVYVAANLEWRLLVIIFGISLFARVICASGKYQMILRFLRCTLPLLEVAFFRLGSAPLKGVLPFKMGEATRIMYLKKVHDVPYTTGVFSMGINYMLSIFVFGSCSVVGLALSSVGSERVWGIAGIVCLCALFLATQWCSVKNMIKKCILKWGGSSSLSTRPRGADVLILIGYSIAFDMSKILNAWLLVRALGLSIPFSIFLARIPLVFLMASLPVTIWGLGSRDVALVTLFSAYMLPEQSLVMSMALLTAHCLIPLFAGVLFMKPFLHAFMGKDK